MLIHSDTLTPEHFARAVAVVNLAARNAPGIGAGDLGVTVTPRRSTLAARAFEFHIGGAAHLPGRRTVTAYGHPAPGGFAFQGTFDEYGFVLAELFDVDPYAIVGRPSRVTYDGRVDFHQVTGLTYKPLTIVLDTARYGEESYPFVRAARVQAGKTGYARFDGDVWPGVSARDLIDARRHHSAPFAFPKAWVQFAPRDVHVMQAQADAITAARESIAEVAA